MNHKLLFSLIFSTLLLAACDQGTDPPAVIPVADIGDATMYEGNGTTKMVVSITLSAATTASVSVNYSTKDGSAKAGSDYTASSSTTTFEPGEIKKTIEIELVADTLREQDESFTISLDGARNATLGDSEASCMILNDDSFTLIEDIGYTTPSSYPGKTLIWSDEFNDANVSTTNWTYEIGTGCPNLCGWGNNERQFYTSRKDNAYQTQGKLVIEAIKESYSGSSYTSARMISRNKKYFKFGRIDMRAKLPEGQGIWPALWMLPNSSTYGWPKGGEIDVMELVGHQPSIIHGTVHYATSTNSHRSTTKSYALSSGKFSDEFHVFSIDWRQDTIEFFVDDKKYQTITRAAIEGGGAIYPFNEPFFFIMNIAVGGNWPGYPNASTVFPQQMAVDYVRVFQ